MWKWLIAASLLLPGAAAAQVNSYTAETTYQKLVKHYPFIRIASDAVPPTVQAVTGLTYIQRGRPMQLDLYLPRQSIKAPVIVLVHGGGWNAGHREGMAPLAIRLAERGHAAATVSYRLSGEALYPAAIHDVKAAVRWVRAHSHEYGIDGGRIALAGASAGGQIASLAGVTSGLAQFDPDGGAVSSAVQAIINIDGLSDFTTPAARQHEDDPAKKPSAAGAWLGGTYAEQTARWHEASPTFYVRRDTPPMLFIGSAQPRFAVGREAMVARLDAAGVVSRVVMLPDTPHSFWLFDPWLQPTVDAMLDFLNTSAWRSAP